MDKKSIVILPNGTDVPEEISSTAEIIAFLQEDGSVKISSNTHDGPDTFQNVNELYNYIGEMQKKDV